MIKLNLGCGVSCQEGWIGIDINPAVKPALVLDLDHADLTYFVGESKVDEIFSSHFLEHSRELIHVLTQMWKVSKPGARWEIHVPPADCEIGNPFHHFRFTEWTFRFFEDSHRFVHPESGLLIAYGVTDGNCPVRLRELSIERTSYANLCYKLEVVK